ncbi:MAG: hypothetical protein ABI281_14740 [Caldimonas sp.]
MNANATQRGSAPERLEHPSPHRRRVAGWAVWFGLLGAPVAWGLQELVNVSLAGHACYPHDTPLNAPLWAHLAAVTVWVGAAAVLLCIAAGGVSFATWQRSRNEKPGDAHQLLGSGDGRTRFMAMAGIMTSLLFLVATSLAILNVSTVPACGG